MLPALIIAEREQREERIRKLEDALAHHKELLGNALDEVAALRADQETRGRLS